SEEQLDNEKYEYKERDFATPLALSMAGLLTSLNAARREHAALRQLRNVAVHATSDDATVAYSRRLPAALAPDGVEDTVLVVLNLDPFNVRESWVYLDLAALGVPHPGSDGAPACQAHDLLSGQTYTWAAHSFVRLDPHGVPGHLFHIRPLG
ncbi:MAG: alpha-1,4-glucan--maltose-1-phosphate maltosyltransferase, partial [Bifidobacteriaceae bacterium]|nr:alpha-1,4-glucan--maltose-1-phosphate maltosyltransferase [Bifidobacteriaceae bacterium]